MDELKERILNEFKRKNYKAGDTLSMVELDIIYHEKLNPKEQKLFKNAVEGLAEESLIEINSGELILTEKGENSIY